MLDSGRLLEQKVLSRFLPIGYTTICCSHVKREDQFAPRTAINCSSGHVRETKGVGKRAGERWSTRISLNGKARSPVPVGSRH